MCEANVYYVDKDGKEQLFMEGVDTIVPGKNGLEMVNIYSERKTVKAKIKEMALVHHRIVLEDED